MSPFQIIDASTDPFMVFTSVLYALLTLIIFKTGQITFVRVILLNP